MFVNMNQLKEMIPEASQASIERFYSPLNAAMEEFDINSAKRIAAFIAQIAHESGNFHYLEEIASGKAYENRKDLGNLEKEAIEVAKKQRSTPGPFYKGRGLLQITGFYNHKRCGKALKLDLVYQPRLLCEPINASRSAAWFWKEHLCNELADQDKFVRITKIINGGTNGLAEREANWVRCKKVLGI